MTNLIPGDTQTNSKRRLPNNAPRYARSGRGAYIIADDGKRYLDYMAALGPVILGYSDPRINAAIVQQLKNGISFSLPTKLEHEVAELICDIVPSAEMVRFGKNGADATAAAVRLAKAYTGKDVIVGFPGHYHGYQDWAADIWQDGPELYWPDDTAAVICEPVPSQPHTTPVDLPELRRRCDETGILLIFDEIVTFGRFPSLTAQAHHNVIPDITCLGKSLANGMPLSAVCGRRDIMELLDHEWYGSVFFSTTYGGETLSLAAAKATLSIMVEERVGEYLWSLASLLTDTIYETTPHMARVLAPFYDQAAMISHGILFQGYFNLMQAHTPEDIHRTLEVCQQIKAHT